MIDIADLSGRVAIVTGCSRGLGADIARVLAERKATVLGLDIAPWDCADGASRHFVQCDLSRPADTVSTVEAIGTEFGRLDILVNNAAVTRVADFFDLTTEDLDRMVDLNLKGSFVMMQAAARLMAATGGGSIVNMSSIAGKGYRKTSNPIYASTKAAIIALTRLGAARLGPLGIRVNAVCPGPTETELMAGWIRDRAASLGIDEAEIRRDITADSALRSVNTPEDVSRLVLFLVSDAARTITGQSINIDGGLVWD